ncbi:lysozyme [Enterobacteriaceae bacterium LUAb1]
MNISQNGVALIKQFEGCSLSSYLCPAGICTIGYGHTAGVSDGEKITQCRADELLDGDLKVAEADVNRLVTVPLRQGQFDALCSFVFNLGAGDLAGSTLLKKLNSGDTAGASDEFCKWVHGGGKVLPGLVKRREAERELFNA